jgi:D-glycero-D-manno-heptose 1,7-bisphosphate phosphatase
MEKALFLDRDGIINKAIVIDGKPYSPMKKEDIVLMDGIEDVITVAQEKEYLVCGITNQPEVARGNLSRRFVIETNASLHRRLKLTDIMACMHDDNDNCSCRKPKPGMLYALAFVYGIDLSQSWMVGDRRSDIEAGTAAGCKTIYVDYGYNDGGLKLTKPWYIVNNILEIKELI